MSPPLTDAIWHRKGRGGSARLLLLALARFADDEGRSRASVRVLAELTGVGERYVRRLLKELADTGDLALEPFPGDRRRRTYRLVKYLSARGAREAHTATTAAPSPPHPAPPSSAPPPAEEPAPPPPDRPAGGYLDIPSRLEALASALPQDLPARSSWLERLQGLGGGEGSASLSEVEEALGHLDRKLLAEMDRRLTPDVRGEVARRVEQAERELAAWIPRMVPAEVDKVRAQIRRRELRRSLELPELSLFAPEAEPRPPPRTTNPS